MSGAQQRAPVPDADITGALCEQVRTAFATQQPLRILGGDTKSFMFPAIDAATITVCGHTGIVSYEPTELVVTARAGTPLQTLESVLSQANQMLPFEPPRFGAAATIGGAVATGLSGPRRPWSGAVRDHVLGVRCISGDGTALRFGGQVIKNVAGYDVSRLMTGAQGTLGIITEVSLKVLPQPELEMTCCFDLDAARAIARSRELAAQALPLSGACHVDGRLSIRFSGSERGVTAAVTQMGGDRPTAAEADHFWQQLRDWRCADLCTAELWRLSVPPATPVMDLSGRTVIDWGGAQRWYTPATAVSEAEAIRALAKAAGGYATKVRGVDDAPLPGMPEGVLRSIHTRLKDAFDPARIFNPGRVL